MYPKGCVKKEVHNGLCDSEITARGWDGNLPNPVHSNYFEVHIASWRHNFKFEVHGGKIGGEEEGSTVQTPNALTMDPALTKDFLT